MKDGFYCAGDFYTDSSCRKDKVTHSNGRVGHYADCDKEDCRHYRRKHETPEQFRERTGREYPDGGAVYVKLKIGCDIWGLDRYKHARERGIWTIILANTDFGPPEGNFEEEGK